MDLSPALLPDSLVTWLAGLHGRDQSPHCLASIKEPAGESFLFTHSQTPGHKSSLSKIWDQHFCTKSRCFATEPEPGPVPRNNVPSLLGTRKHTWNADVMAEECFEPGSLHNKYNVTLLTLLPWQKSEYGKQNQTLKGQFSTEEIWTNVTAWPPDLFTHNSRPRWGNIRIQNMRKCSREVQYSILLWLNCKQLPFYEKQAQSKRQLCWGSYNSI